MKFNVDVVVNYHVTVEAKTEEDAKFLAEQKFYESTDNADVLSSEIVQEENKN